MSAPTTHEVVSSLGDGVSVTQTQNGDGLTLTVGVRAGSECVLHWGLTRQPGGAWHRPPEQAWPEGSAPADGQALRSPFHANGNGERQVTIRLPLPCRERNLTFVVHFPQENRWLRSGGKDFVVPLPEGAAGLSPETALASWVPGDEVARQSFSLDGGNRLAVATRRTPDGVCVSLACDAAAPLVLHWGLAPHFRHEWQLPPEDCRPAGTTVFDALAVRTTFTERDGLQYLELEFRKPADGPGPRGLRFVLFQPEGGAWLKAGGKDLYLPLFEGAADPRLPSAKLAGVAEQIIAAETGAASWTLMHRFNLCHDLLGEVEDDEEGLALLFAWLRYSAIRQLDWQRQYNTKPRELSHAQDRLTARLAGVWRRHPAGSGSRRWARLMLTTLGRGGDGQRVRDEILQIMHRNGVREAAGHFIEEWHQKLHNNTTPDDVVICEAYLAFMRANGDVGTFYKTLKAGGVTRERLQGFERPIRTDPILFGDKKDALIGEFENFLRILKSVHAGTDLDTAAGAARGRLDGGLQQRLDGLFGLRHRRAPVKELAPAVTAVREGLAGALAGTQDDAAARDLLFLNLALEELLRGALEREQVSRLDRNALVDLVQAALDNVRLSTGAQEVARCGSHWAALRAQPRDGKDWALHAKSVADRAGRWVQGFTSDLYGRLQPKAEFLGAAFGAEAWTVPLFSEEVIRGGPVFALSLLLRPLDPLLRQAAGLGGWQVISPARAGGRVRLAARLLDVQTERFAEPTVIVTDAVAGNEEIPEGVTAVLTSATPDLVSHVAVRARNAGVLFATCFDAATYDRVKELRDRIVSLQVTPGGDVVCREGAGDGRTDLQSVHAAGRIANPSHRPEGPRPATRFPGWVLTQDQFAPGVVGGKSNNLNGLRGRLPDWIHLPASLALPFGAGEAALADAANRGLRGRYESLVASAEQDPAGVLPRVRALLQELAPPSGLQPALQEAWRRVGLPPLPWEQTWATIRKVWASKWNERAYLSRRARGVAHDSLLMAVLIQQVVEADYAFVIHTANPLTGNRDELYAEVVLGLGETLVGNYPGRALGFVCRKGDLALDLVSYPGKSVGLYGRGVIFRSDSNGEDLEDFAGAGLYDSFLAEEPEHRPLDYTREKLVWDRGFRDDLLRKVAQVGIEVERLLGSPQDIEGAVAGGKFHVVQTRPQVGLAGA
jgi:alpha-glucan,water dikinase